MLLAWILHVTGSYASTNWTKTIIMFGWNVRERLMNYLVKFVYDIEKHLLFPYHSKNAFFLNFDMFCAQWCQFLVTFMRKVVLISKNDFWNCLFLEGTLLLFFKNPITSTDLIYNSFSFYCPFFLFNWKKVDTSSSISSIINVN